MTLCLCSSFLAGMVSTLAGVCGSTGQRDGTGQSALFSDSIQSITCLANCSVLVADQANGRLRQAGARGCID